MKRSRTWALRLAVLGAAAGMVLASTERGQADVTGFAVTAPGTGDLVAAGSTVDITWTVSNANERMGIWLVDTDEWVIAGEIAVNIPDDGHESWSVPSSLPPGDYQIYLENQSITDWTYGTPFTVY